ncbi:hypothetical protein ANAPC5_01428 [Anaplasma phagocytophilum]|nr:hypothetical protein ANAPC5_01428 [Anaplasma phagocytophilum]
MLNQILSHVNVGEVILKGVTMAHNNCGTRLVIKKLFIKTHRSQDIGATGLSFVAFTFLAIFRTFLLENSSLRKYPKLHLKRGRGYSVSICR